MPVKGLIDLLEKRKDQAEAGIFFIESSQQEQFLSYKDLYREAVRTLGALQQGGMKPKDELVFQLDDNKTFVILFWACILGGIVPVPLALGVNDSQKEKLFHVWSILDRPHLAASPSHLSGLASYTHPQLPGELFAEMSRKTVDPARLSGIDIPVVLYHAGVDDVALIQFSSGSTGTPKGVLLTHRNLIANLSAISEAARYTAADSALSWMPLTHDMGLIGFHLNPLLAGMDQYLIPTGIFARRPSIWLDIATSRKATILSAPNFGYEYLLKHCADIPSQGWDLSSVRILYNGAEPISEKLCRKFLDRLLVAGLDPRAMCPVYGLAEASVAVSFSTVHEEIQSVFLERGKLNTGQKVADSGSREAGVSFVNVGRAIRDCAVRIADADDKLCPAEVVGHVQITGTNVTKGYYNNEQATRDLFTQDGWLRTGDLGFFRKGSLYITGREKDILFASGQNFYPHDLERMAEEVAGIQLNKIAIAGYFDGRREEEEVIVFILHRGTPESFAPLAEAVREHLCQRTGILIRTFIPVDEMPKTTSGKLQHFKLLERFRNGDFREVLEKVEALALSGQTGLRPAVPPATALENKLLEIWKRVLYGEDFGVGDNFFHIGGNSLRAAEMALLLERELEIEIPAEQLYSIRTIRALAETLPLLPHKAYLPVPILPEDGLYGAGSAQKRLYYLWKLDRLSISYNLPVSLSMRGVVSGSQLQEAFQKLVERHDCLRMTFHEELAGIKLVLHQSVEFSLAFHECTTTEVPQVLRRLIRPFDLEKTPLFRAALVTTGLEEHVLFIDLHHSVCDGISVPLLLRDLFELYAGKAPRPPRIRFVDYAAWETARLLSDPVRRQATYWLDILTQGLPVLELPTETGRPPIFVSEGGKKFCDLDGSMTGRLRELADATHSTLHVLLFSVYELLLYKYTGQQDMIIGIPVAGRRHPDALDVPGMFVNNLPIRGTIADGMTFLEMVRENGKRIAEALDNQDLPFEEMIRQTGVGRDISRNVLFDTMFIYQHGGFSRAEKEGLQVRRYAFDPGFAKYDVSLEVVEEADCLSCGIEYSKGLFTAERIEVMAGHFQRLLQWAVDHPYAGVSTCTMLGKEEYDSVVIRFNDTETPYPAEIPIHAIFEEMAAGRPEAIALEYNGKQMTYGLLQERSDRLAAQLKGMGRGAGDVTGILLPRSENLIVSILGVLKCGSCFLPIDMGLPDDRISYMLSNSECRTLITSTGNMDRASTFAGGRGSGHFELLNIERPVVLSGEEDAVIPPVPSSDLAYIIYTSGTTGNPKGVMIRHRSLVNYIYCAAKQYVGADSAAFPLYTSISFDLTITSIFVPLVTGNRIVLYDEDDKDLLIEKVIADNKVNVLKLTPSHLKILLHLEPLKRKGFSSITTLIVGGENLEARLAADIHALFGGRITIYNEYGPTEATIGCMIYKFDPRLDTAGPVPIGGPIGNTQIYLLDKWLVPVPAGVKGELYIAGCGLAAGYRFSEEMTSRKFVSNPFKAGERMYKTGDWAIRESNGKVKFLGRMDHQVKINGYRIELGEIESCLLEHENIQKAAVICREENNSKFIYAYYVTRDGSAVEAKEVKYFLSGRLPGYMIPRRLLQIGDIPLTLNGKLDSSQLSACEPVPGKENCDSNAGELETILQETWKEVLGKTDISAGENFFELGGDSIKAVQLSGRLFGRQISVKPRDILLHQTIEQLLRHNKVQRKTVSYEQRPLAGIKPLSPIDRWFFDLQLTYPGYYTQSVLLHTGKLLSRELLQKAFTRLTAHHDALRLNWNEAEHDLYFKEGAASAFCLEEMTLTPLASRDAMAEIREICGRVRSEVSLIGGPLIKAVLFRRSPLQDWLFITVHHLATDGISWRILLDDLREVYSLLERGLEPRLPMKTGSLLDWHQSLMTYMQSEGLHAQRAYWAGIAGALPVHPGGPLQDCRRVERLTFVLHAEQTAVLTHDLPRILRVNVQTVLLTALVKAWSNVTETDVVFVEMEHHGRNIEDINVSRTVGWFTALFPLKLTIVRDYDIGQLVDAIDRQIKAVPDKGLGFGVLKYLRGAEMAATGSCPIRFNYLGDLGRELNNELFQLSSLYTGPESAPGNPITVPVSWDCMISDGCLITTIHYDTLSNIGRLAGLVLDGYKNYLNRILIHVEDAGREMPLSTDDFNTSGLDQEDLNALFNDHSN